jgi:hypothetical protein
MDLFFADPNEIRLPPDEVRIRDLQVQVLEQGRRVKVYLEVDPFQKRPSAELTIIDPQGFPVANVSIIESMLRKMELTMHLRGEPRSGKHTIEAVLFYATMLKPDEPSQQETGLQGPASQEVGSHELGQIERQVVDTSSRVFEMP